MEGCVREPILCTNFKLLESNYSSEDGKTSKLMELYINSSVKNKKDLLISISKDIETVLSSLSSTSDLSNMACLFVNQGYPLIYEKICARIRANSLLFTNS